MVVDQHKACRTKRESLFEHVAIACGDGARPALANCDMSAEPAFRVEQQLQHRLAAKTPQMPYQEFNELGR